MYMTSTYLSFKLESEHIAELRQLPNPFNGNRLGALVRDRTYARIKEDGTLETWYDICLRVVEGCYTIQKNHILKIGKEWKEEKAQQSAKEMLRRMYIMKFLPGGRSLWCMGTDVIHKKGLGMALNNCAAISTINIKNDPSRVFEVLMDMSMLGTGVGVDTKGADIVNLYSPVITPNQLGLTYVTIDDSRESWVSSVRSLIDSYCIEDSPQVVFDYSQIREKGKKLKVFGGVSSGPQPLVDLHRNIIQTLDRELEKSDNPKLTSTGIVDICNHIGVCVVSGGIRRTALITFGEPTDEEFLDLKNYEKNPHRISYAWTSNNSVLVEPGQDYTNIQKRICDNGEPGIAILSNMKNYARMDIPNFRDRKVIGGNPCLEISLESYELCNLTENFINRHEDFDDYIKTQKYSFLYAKTVSLVMTHIEETNIVISRNRRIGSSITGIAQFLGRNNITVFRTWIRKAYNVIREWDNVYSNWFHIPNSIKVTAIKPSGTLSLLAGATPGVHYPWSRWYIRTVRLTVGNPLIDDLRNEGFYLESCVVNPSHTMIVSFPVDIGKCRTLDDVTMYEQLELAAFMQQHYADNQVSCTVTFTPEEGKHIAAMMEFYQFRLKGISFLPRSDNKYPQMPYQKITCEEYMQHMEDIEQRKRGVKAKRPRRYEDSEPTQFCDGERCVLNL